MTSLESRGRIVGVNWSSSQQKTCETSVYIVFESEGSVSFLIWLGG